MAYPTGSGSERLRRGVIYQQSSSDTSLTFDSTNPTKGAAGNTVPALHIITMLTITFRMSSTGSNIYMYTIAGGITSNLLEVMPLAANETFVWNDRFVLEGGDALKVTLGGSGTYDLTYSYIDQDWT